MKGWVTEFPSLYLCLGPITPIVGDSLSRAVALNVRPSVHSEFMVNKYVSVEVAIKRWCRIIICWRIIFRHCGGGSPIVHIKRSGDDRWVVVSWEQPQSVDLFSSAFKFKCNSGLYSNPKDTVSQRIKVWISSQEGRSLTRSGIKCMLQECT